MIAGMIAAPALPAAPFSAARPDVQAIATVRIVRSLSTSEKDWLSQPADRRRQILIREKDGRITTVRLIEHE